MPSSGHTSCVMLGFDSWGTHQYTPFFCFIKSQSSFSDRAVTMKSESPTYWRKDYSALSASRDPGYCFLEQCSTHHEHCTYTAHWGLFWLCQIRIKIPDTYFGRGKMLQYFPIRELPGWSFDSILTPQNSRHPALVYKSSVQSYHTERHPPSSVGFTRKANHWRIWPCSVQCCY